jgi:hypothetical protein
MPRKLIALPLLTLLCLLFIVTSCSKTETQNGGNTAGATANGNSVSTANTSAQPSLKPGETPFGFPLVNTTAKAGEFVLAPSYIWIQNAAQGGPDKVTFIFYNQKMVAPGEVESEVEFLSPGKQKISNAYVIPIPNGQTAKVGDIVLTWWQSGSGMNRAIVVEASNPAEPTVRYLDIEYDNPAKSRDGSTTIGKMEEKLKPNTFVKLNNTWEPGTAVAAKDGGSMKHAHIVRVANDKVLTLGFAGRMKAYNKSDCTPLPVAPVVKAGDKVKVPFAGTFADATVTRVDAKIGRVFVRVGSATDEKAIAFGNVATSL